MICPGCLHHSDPLSAKGESFKCSRCEESFDVKQTVGGQPLLRWRCYQEKSDLVPPKRCDLCKAAEASWVKVDWKRERESTSAITLITIMAGVEVSRLTTTTCTGLHALCCQCTKTMKGTHSVIKALILLTSGAVGGGVIVGGASLLDAYDPGRASEHPWLFGLVFLLGFLAACFVGSRFQTRSYRDCANELYLVAEGFKPTRVQSAPK